MALKRNFTDRDILAYIKQKAEKIESDLVGIMRFVGERFVSDARSAVNIDTSKFPARRTIKDYERRKQNLKNASDPVPGDYLDDTANLRSSIGFFILKNGFILHQDLEGDSQGTLAAIEAMRRIPKIDIQLIGVAGMEYASYLESKGYNVITSQGDVAVVDLERLWKRYALRKNLKKY